MKRPILTVCTAIGVLILLGLGTWQMQRLQWKENLVATVEARTAQAPSDLSEVLRRARAGDDIRYWPVAVTGGFPTDRTAHVFGTDGGEPGWFVFQPFRPDGMDAVLLVNRGFVPQAERAATYPLPDAAALTGLAREFEGAGGPAALVRIAPDIEAGTLHERTKASLVAVFPEIEDADVLPIYLDSTLPTERPRGGATRIAFSNRHLGYAITWYGLAAGLVGVYLAMRRRG